MLQIARSATLLAIALFAAACVDMKNPTTTLPDNVFYYRGKAKDMAMCWLDKGPVNDRCIGSNAMTAAAAEDGNTYLIRCQRTGVVGPGAGAAGAGLMGFIIGQAVDSMVESSFDPAADKNTVFMAAFRDVADDKVETRLWMTETLLNNDARFTDLKTALDTCGGGAPLSDEPAATSASRPLQPTTVVVPNIDPALLGKTETPATSSPAQPKTTPK
ncbi:hypothetical protein [Zavarzinia aquatilis]|uniref:Lipoprotein n=1 Tax=Zavarzinia aquatilis TaxID=2211142 RepID=A0A317EFQ2_9PROT|nr:hypothetical protein [Zavarzinia aquatilis]PWR25888.1 hypothetical protein DKG74_02755 [Zavarzinia aquatilis]